MKIIKSIGTIGGCRLGGPALSARGGGGGAKQS
jgi:hypothetical protein